jgi:SPP1 gp7 family putative phage head morphogenesis protein
MIEQIHKRFKNIVIAGMNKEYIKEQIIDASYVSLLEELLEKFKESIKKQFGLLRISEWATNITKIVYGYNERRWIEEIGKFGIDLKKDISYQFLKEYLNLRIADNSKLIKNLQDEVIYELEQEIYKHFEQGKTFKELSKSITERFGMDKKRANLIARNEIKNTNTQLNKKRMQEYGVEKAIWMTADDERVRTQHEKFNGKEYEIGKGLKNDKGEFEEPGEKINCRCVAIPII